MRVGAISKCGCLDVIEELRALIARCIGAPANDAPIGQERYLKGVLSAKETRGQRSRPHFLQRG